MPWRCRQGFRTVYVTTAYAVIAVNSTFPGNAWKPLDSLPLRPPPLRTPDQEVDESGPITDSDAPMPYTAFSPEHHLSPEVEVDGKISVLPFNMSPRSLPDLFRSAELRTLMMDLMEDGPALQIQRSFQVLPGVEIQLANMKEKPDADTNAVVRFESDSLEVDFLACYPVLLPIHLVRFRYTADGETDRLATVALGAWDERLMTYALQSEQKEGWVTKNPSSWANIAMADFEPDVPIATPAPDGKDGKGETKTSDARIVELMAQQSQMQAVLETRADTLVTQADWDACIAWEREHAPKEATVEADMGLGTSVDFDAASVRPLYEGVEDNRQYLALEGEVLFSSRLLASVERDRSNGQDMSNVHTLRDGEMVSGDDAIEALQERLAEMKVTRDAKRPSWLSELDN